MLLGLMQNIALIIVLSVIQQMILRRWKRHALSYHLLSGILFGGVAVAGMMMPVRLAPGIIFDGRSIILGVAGLFGGPGVAAIAAFMAGGYRLLLGGSGVVMGTMTVLESAAIGSAFYYLRKRDSRWVSLPALWLFGLIIHAIMLALTLTLPPAAMASTLRAIAFPVLVIYPLAVVLVCWLMLEQESRLLSEDALRASEQRYRLLAENMVDCVWTSDMAATLTYVSSAIRSIAGYSPEEWLGTKASAHLSEADWDVLYAAVSKALTQLPEAAAIICEVEIIAKDGHPVPVEWTSTVMVDASGTAVGLQGTTHDITERKRAELETRRLNQMLERTVDERTEELQAANEELELANKTLAVANEAKTRFVRAMSHELRTPLNSIIGFSDLLGKGLAGELNEEQRKQIGMVHQSGQHLLALVNDILDLSRIEADALEYHFEPIGVGALASETLETMTPDARAKNLDVRLELPEQEPALISDARKVQQILLNLLANAVKFTTEGTITLRIDALDRGRVAFSVIDTGSGIPEGRNESIFGEFVQGVDDRLVPQTGTGLGLAISRGLANRLGGTLMLAETTPGQGSTFTLTLPLTPPQSATALV